MDVSSRACALLWFAAAAFCLFTASLLAVAPALTHQKEAFWYVTSLADPLWVSALKFASVSGSVFAMVVSLVYLLASLRQPK